jgi:hypothetical protein
VRCSLIYRVPTRGVAAFRTYEDFRGANLTVKLLAGVSSFKPTGAHFYPVGYAISKIELPKFTLRQSSNGEPTIVAAIQIPGDYLSPPPPGKTVDPSAHSKPEPPSP